MTITIKRFLYLLLLLSCLFNYGCDKDDPSLENNFDPLTGLRFISIPENQVFHNDKYQYTPEAENRHTGDMTYNLIHAPDWLIWSETTKTLSGKPTADNLGEFFVSVSVSNDKGSLEQSFVITVELREIHGGSWYNYSRYKWLHDGKPDTMDYCIVFSDGAHDNIKQEIGILSDQLFQEVLTDFNFNQQEDFLYPPDESKIHVYVNRFHEENIAAAYWGCFLITFRTNDITEPRWEYYLDYTIKHELTHVFEFLLEGEPELGTDVWFREGIAIRTGGGMRHIITLQEMENWIIAHSGVPGGGNPVSIHQWEDFPPNANYHEYYWYFELAMNYLLDPDGLGKSNEDVLNLFYDVRNGDQFEVTFERNFGISLTNFEDEFFDRIRDWI